MVAMTQKRFLERTREEDAKAAAAKTTKAEYFITDPNARNFGNVRVKPGQVSVILEAEQAKMFLGSGLDTVSPAERAKQAEAAEAKDAEHRAKFEEHEAKRIEAAATEAAKHAEKGQDGGDKAEGANGGPDPVAPVGGHRKPRGQ